MDPDERLGQVLCENFHVFLVCKHARIEAEDLQALELPDAP